MSPESLFMEDVIVTELPEVCAVDCGKTVSEPLTTGAILRIFPDRLDVVEPVFIVGGADTPPVDKSVEV